MTSKRPWILFGCFIILPVISFILPRGWRLVYIDTILPLIVALCTRLVLREKPPHFRTQGPVFSIILSFATAFAVLLTIIVTYKSGWSDFSYGALQDSKALLREIFFIKIPITILITSLGYEYTLRKKLMGYCGSRWPALLISSLAGFLIQWPRLYLSNGTDESFYMISGACEILLLELLCGQLFLLTGRITSCIIFHSFLRSVDMYLMGDTLNPYFPLRVFSSSSPLFYFLKAVVPCAFVLIFAFWIQKRAKSCLNQHS